MAGLAQVQPIGADLGPFPVKQSKTNVADMAKADVSGLGEFGDTLGSLWRAQHNPEDLCCFRLEY